MQALKESVCLLGGSFDPPHLGHMDIANQLLIDPGVRKVILVPATQTPLKNPSIASAIDRLNMVKIQFENKDPRIEISDYEIKKSNPPHFSIETIDHFLNHYKPLSFVIGWDQLIALPRWKGYPDLLKKCHWIAIQRSHVREVPNNLKRFDPDTFSLYVPHWIPADTSSQEIRSMIKEKHTHGLAQKLDSKVLDYIIGNKLYGY